MGTVFGRFVSSRALVGILVRRTEAIIETIKARNVEIGTLVESHRRDIEALQTEHRGNIAKIAEYEETVRRAIGDRPIATEDGRDAGQSTV